VSQKGVVAKLEVLYTKLPRGTEEDHKRPEGVTDIRAEIRTLYYPNTGPKAFLRKSTYLKFFIVSLSPYSKSKDFTSNLAAASSFLVIASSLFTAYSIVR
jgi:hypothetical protein